VILKLCRGQFHCVELDGCKVSVRFDSGRIQSFTGRQSSDFDNRVLFITPYDRFVTQLRKAKKLQIEADFFQEGSRVLEFDVAGFDF
jgi:hypothetical protein